jgi:hypothetical protein
MLKDPVPALVLIDADREFWPSYEALKSAYCINSGMLSDYCRCNLPSRVFSTENDFDSQKIMQKPKRSQYSGQLQARICLGEGRRRSSVGNAFERAPHLEAVTWITLDSDKAAVDSFRFLPHLPLSHLRLIIPSGLYMLLNRDYEFPYLRHLEFRFRGEHERSEPISGTLTWNLPKLSILRVDGSLSNEAKNSIDDLIFKARNTLTSLLISCNYATIDSKWKVYRGNPSMLDSIYNLSLFGLDIIWFLENHNKEIPGPNPSTPREVPITAYLDHFTLPTLYFSHDTALKCARGLLEWCGRFTFGIKLVMSSSWEQLAKQMVTDKSLYMNPMIVFFTEIFAGDIPFYDKNEVRLGDEGTAFFIEGLRTGEFPEYFLRAI